MNIDALNSQFGIRDKVVFIQTADGLVRADICAVQASAQIYLQGAQVTSFKLNHQSELLWLSPLAQFEKKIAIRGGIPICWPWFGKHPTDQTLPQHGFARTSEFEMVSVTQNSSGEIALTLCLKSSSSSRAIWPYDFELQVNIQVGETLKISVTTLNRSPKKMPISEAIHSYFLVDDIEQVKLTGLGDVAYVDKLTERKLSHPDNQLKINAETDRIYSCPPENLVIERASGEKIKVNQQQADATVVWNPWVNKSAAMQDFPDDGYQKMLCVEAANVGTQNCQIQSNAQKTLVQQIGFIAGG